MGPARDRDERFDRLVRVGWWGIKGEREEGGCSDSSGEGEDEEEEGGVVRRRLDKSSYL